MIIMKYAILFILFLICYGIGSAGLFDE